ncbi:Elf1-domain-containing protein [Westerdykella ornata]|uniref:Transcription elongation factor 1 homolog n=1 Tax=Westerdykella ornata TaxID=318751 RepID=A0A6A6J813_WESOR|nr:Elf1-domain-containing protein [Westerdykella ornata]KAF2272303.1 Elf1-domain-containing protein [Westerdykella ornata]
MGKRKKAAKKPQGPKKKEKLSTTFQCLFCNHENSVVVHLEKKSSVGNLHCKVCGQDFQTPISVLTAPVDVYADWIDACEDVAKRTATGKSENRIGGPPRAAAAAAMGGAGAEDDLDGFIENDEADAEADYGDDDE